MVCTCDEIVQRAVVYRSNIIHSHELRQEWGERVILFMPSI